MSSSEFRSSQFGVFLGERTGILGSNSLSVRSFGVFFTQYVRARAVLSILLVSKWVVPVRELVGKA